MDGKTLKEKREKFGLSQRELVDAIGCAQARIWEWENGIKKYPSDQVQVVVRTDTV
jgi:transcriptional regulator with XRE-family HTH domain